MSVCVPSSLVIAVHCPPVRPLVVLACLLFVLLLSSHEKYRFPLRSLPSRCRCPLPANCVHLDSFNYLYFIYLPFVPSLACNCAPLACYHHDNDTACAALSNGDVHRSILSLACSGALVTPSATVAECMHSHSALRLVPFIASLATNVSVATKIISFLLWQVRNTHLCFQL